MTAAPAPKIYPEAAKITVAIPAFNEEQGIAATLQSLLSHPVTKNFEIIVVDDGSQDGTAAIVKQFPQVTLISHDSNRGYGAAIRSAALMSSGEYIFWFDSDGQHRAEDLAALASTIREENLDYVIGTRDERSHEVFSRRFGKALLRLTVRVAASTPIHDFNCGLRGFRRSVLMRYMHFLPKGFGASTTTTLLMVERAHRGKFQSVVIKERVGKSSVKQFRDGTRTLMLILHIFLVFKPMTFFGSIGLAALAIGSAYSLYEALSKGIGFPVLGAVIIIFGLQSVFFGLLCDQIASMRRESMES